MSSKNFDLSEEEFLALVKKLKAGDNSLFERVFVSRFEKSCAFISKKYNVDKDEAYDLTMDTLLAFRRAIILDKISYGNLNYLFTLMVKQRLYREKKKEKKYDAYTIREALYSDVYELYEENDTFRLAVAKAWSELKEECRSLFDKLFYKGIQLKKIAEMDNLHYETVKKRRQRCIGYYRELILKYNHG